MALTDIDFSEGDNQNFLVEIPLGAVNATTDILTEPESAQYPLLEIQSVATEGDIFIIND